jgi:hypothetical protein
LEYSDGESAQMPLKRPKLGSDHDADANMAQIGDADAPKTRRGKNLLPEQLIATGDHICDDNWEAITQILDAETQQRLALSNFRLLNLADEVRMRRARHDDIKIDGLASARWYLLYYTELFVPPCRLCLRLELRPECGDEAEFNMTNAGAVIERFSELGSQITHILVDGRYHKSHYELRQCGEIDVSNQIGRDGNLHPDFDAMLLLPSEWMSPKCISTGFVNVLRKLHTSLVELHLINVGISSHVMDDLILLPPSQIASAEARCSGIFASNRFTSLVLERLLTEDDVSGVVGRRVELASINNIMQRCAGFAQLQKLGLSYNGIAINQETVDSIFTLPNLFSLSMRYSTMENDAINFSGAVVTDKLYVLNVDNTSANQLINLSKLGNFHNISAHRVRRDFLSMLRAQVNNGSTLHAARLQRSNANRFQEEA